jgi:hypothetical protein
MRTLEIVFNRVTSVVADVVATKHGDNNASKRGPNLMSDESSRRATSSPERMRDARVVCNTDEASAVPTFAESARRNVGAANYGRWFS